MIKSGRMGWVGVHIICGGNKESMQHFGQKTSRADTSWGT